jgi:2,4-dienoyl-CoA reductase-like NADH-dependent reductase (Old Yellow Enzyme family)
MPSLFESVRFQRGPAMANRFMLAPLTNSQSHDDGTLSEAEQHWLTLRADGGFGMVMTCAAHVQATGQGFPGQLGIFGDQHLPGLTGLARALNERGAVSVVQLHHAGMRSPAELIGEAPHCPSVNEEFGARALTGAEVEQVVEAFVAAAVRAERAGFHGVELHGAHGYLLCQFLSAETNRREDDWGGSLEGRARILFEIVRGIRARCGADFLLGVRLSPERFGMELGEVLEVAQRLVDTGEVDFLDLSLWDCFKEPELEAYRGRSLLSWFMDLERRAVKLGPAGKIRTPADAQRVLDAGADFVVLGRAAILHHDYPARLAADSAFEPVALPVPPAWLAREGLSPPFVNYMRNWKGFVAD